MSPFLSNIKFIFGFIHIYTVMLFYSFPTMKYENSKKYK